MTPALLGASPWPTQAFRSAVVSDGRRWWCTEREAIDASWAEGNGRELVAAHAAAQLGLAARPTGEGA